MDMRKEFFDCHAEKWDKFLTADMQLRIEHEVVPLLGIASGEQVLDVGCGTGVLLPFLQKQAGPAGRVTALDYAQKMIDKAREKYGAAYTYVCAPVEKMPFANDSFDTVVCFSVFPHFPDKAAAFAEIRRVLKPGGSVVVAHADSRETINSFHAGIGGPVGQDRLPEDSVMHELFATAGFCAIQIREGETYYVAQGLKTG